jgi:hypothetical protein
MTRVEHHELRIPHSAFRILLYDPPASLRTPATASVIAAA